jgi:hypothetical protein
MAPFNFTELFGASDPEEYVRNSDLGRGGRTELSTNLYNQILPSLFRHADGSPLTNGTNQHSWTADFHSTGGFEDSISAFHRDANGTTIALSDHFEHFAGTILFVAWQKHFQKDLPKFQEAIENGANTLQLGDDLDKIEDAFMEALKDFKHDPQWLYACARVKRFCLLAGSPTTSVDPFRSIDALRAVAIDPSSSSRESRLEAEIQQLREQNKSYEERIRLQSRIITNLSYRHLMEHLPCHKSGSNTANWKAFWRHALQNAGQNAEHPLAVLRTRFGSDQRMLEQIQKVGEDMYSTLSTNIHHFQGVYNMEPSQWDELPGAILQALAPKNLTADGGVEWVAERSRY